LVVQPIANSSTLGEAVRDRQFISSVVQKGGKDNLFMLWSDKTLIPSSGETLPALAAASEYSLFGQNTTASSKQAKIRIYAAGSAGNVSPDEGIDRENTEPDLERGPDSRDVNSALRRRALLPGVLGDVLTPEEEKRAKYRALLRVPGDDLTTEEVEKRNKVFGVPGDVLSPEKAKNRAMVYGELPGGPWDFVHAKSKRAMVSGAGILGGVIFIGPMILMVLVKGTLCRLLTSGLCIMAFGLGLAFGPEISILKPLSPFEVLTGTTAYAAVLTVFVGAAITE
jgi:hypothetical protein